MAIHLARRSRRSQDARGLVAAAAARGEAGDAVGSVHVQMGNRCAYGSGHRSGAVVELAALVDRLATDHDIELWRRARADGDFDAMARRALRAGGDACGSQARLSNFRAHARALTALPPGTQDRWTDARA